MVRKEHESLILRRTRVICITDSLSLPPSLLSLTLSLSLSLLPPSLPPDNDYEIGEEPEHTWGWDRYKGKPQLKRSRGRGRGKTKRHNNLKLDGWLSKRKKINNLIDECETILSAASQSLAKKLESSSDEASCSPLTTANLSSLPGCGKFKDESTQDEDSDSDTVIYDYEEEEVGGVKGAGPSCGKTAAAVTSSMVECPLCGELFPHYAIEVHAGNCGEPQTAVSAYSKMTAPIVID